MKDIINILPKYLEKYPIFNNFLLYLQGYLGIDCLESTKKNKFIQNCDNEIEKYKYFIDVILPEFQISLMLYTAKCAKYEWSSIDRMKHYKMINEEKCDCLVNNVNLFTHRTIDIYSSCHPDNKYNILKTFKETYQIMIENKLLDTTYSVKFDSDIGYFINF